MNPKRTWQLVLLTLACAGCVYFFELRRNPEEASGAALVIPGFRPDAVLSVEVSRTNPVTRAPFQVRLGRQKDEWAFENPYYPAQRTGIESLLNTLAQLPNRAHITAREMAAGDLKAFGLEPPEAAITISTPTNRIRLEVGARTPIANQVYLQIVGSPGIYLTDAKFLEHIPSSAAEWRDPRLLDFSSLVFDRIQIKSGSRLVEVERDRTNLLWKITRPMQARADSNSVAQLIRELRVARAAGFVKDPPVLDLEPYGLQPPEAELALGLETNTLAFVQFGASPTNDAAHVYARLSQHTNIVLVDKEVAERFRLSPRALQDTRLIVTPPHDRIEIRAAETFTISRQPNGSWRVGEPFNFWADPGLLREMVTNINELKILDFAKDVPSDVDLLKSHLLPPLRQYSFYTLATNAAGLPTNILSAQLDIGTNQIDRVYVRRRDENPIYFTTLDSLELPSFSWELRDRNIWNFAPTNILSVQHISGGKTNELRRTAGGQWSSDTVKNAAFEESIYRLGRLRALAWVARGSRFLKPYGLQPPAARLVLEVRTADRSQLLPLEIGLHVRDVLYASLLLEGDPEPLIFQLPERLYLDFARELGASAR